MTQVSARTIEEQIVLIREAVEAALEDNKMTPAELLRIAMLLFQLLMTIMPLIIGGAVAAVNDKN